MRRESAHGRAIEVAPRIEPSEAGGRGQLRQQLALCRLDVDGVALVSALGEAIDQRDGVALGAAVLQLAGHEQRPHLSPRRR
jgi:hypothetical protein